MQYFGVLETKYEELFLTSSYMYFNYDDKEISANDLKKMLKTNKDKKKNIIGTVFLYNPLVTPKGYDSNSFLLEQDFDEYEEMVELKVEGITTILKNAMEGKCKGKIVEIKHLFNLVEKNINVQNLLLKFDHDLEKYYTRQNTEFDRDIMYLDCQNIIPKGKFVFFAWGDKISQKTLTFIRVYANTLFNRSEDMGKNVSFVYKAEKGIENSKYLLQFSNPVENYKFKNSISNAIKKSFEEFPPTPQAYE